MQLQLLEPGHCKACETRHCGGAEAGAGAQRSAFLASFSSKGEKWQSYMYELIL